MSKLMLPLAGIGGASAAGLGGYMLMKGNEKAPAIQKEETFRTKYSQAILGDTDDLWNTKFDTLKGTGQPSHQKLKDAKTKSGVSGPETEAKELHKQGCREIYDSEIKSSLYLTDFQTYCSKTIKDAIDKSKNWISSEAGSTTGDWDSQLTQLKSHDETNKGALDSKLKTLVDKLKQDSHSVDEADRKAIKEWCDSTQKEIFMGESDHRFSHSQLYCIKDAEKQ
ncbi:hypothetical protein HF1_07960 [Mycoplasma haemofelis str. Langford 1]|uniref:Uncharacterized protein n=1 Tax=Mycoplasma haemofelis (strain Langford 1) TaxID=941640 RepID=E8ZI33_MYCHL|nr:hypothetical protein [Mycoplasma haemofelis]CBY92804.1 hypothetical protein HF1_07960 [Mycoplasma haemofelis str. Langford 1]